MIDPLGIKKNDPLGLKKKVATKSVSQEELWGSDSQPQDLYTSLATGAQEPQQVSDGLDGDPNPILKGLPSVESLKKKPIQPKKDVIETIKDVVPVISKNLSIEKEDFSEATQKARKESKTLIDKKQINQRVSEVGNIQNEYIKSLKEINILKKELSDEKSDIDYQISIGNNTPEFQEKITLHNNKVKENLNKFNLLKDKSEIISYNKKVIESASGNLLRKKAEQGNWFGALYNKMLEGVSSMSSGAASLATDLISEAMPSEYLLNPKELKELKDKGLDQDKIDDYIKKSAKKDILPIIRKSNVELLGDKGTTKEYIEKKQASSLLAGGVLGLAESAPAMIGGVYGRAANFFLMGTDAVNKEMESNPDFKNITENEKLAVTIPIGIANAVLEEFGLQNIIKNNSLVNKLIHKTLLKVGANSSANVFRRAMNDEVKSGLAAGVFKLTTGFAGEAVTGGSQQAAEIGVKDIYNVIKDKRMFQTPETLSDAIYEISDAAIMEGIGGTIMSTLPAINKAINNNELGKKSSDFEFELLDNINENSDEFKRLFVSDLKNKIIDGKIDKEEANSQLESFDKMVSVFNRMPKDMSVEDKKKSFDLLIEKENLTNEISGKDESLSIKQKERISEINKELSNISLGVKPVVEAAEPVVEEVVKPTEEQILKDKLEGNLVTFTYKDKSEVPDAFKDTIPSEVEVNGEKSIKVTVAKSLADYELSKATKPVVEAKVTPEVTTTTETKPITEEVATEAKAKAYSEELDKTKESDPEAYWSVSPVSAEDAAKGTIIDTPDGAAIVKPDGDIAGLFKKATSKAKGVAQDLLKRAVAAGGKKLDNFDTYLTPQYIKAGFRVVSRVPFSLEYGVPDGYNKEKHGTPDVVAMVYDPEGKLDIEEKTFDDYDEAMAYRDSFIEPSIEMELEGLAKLFDESDRGFKMSQVDKAKEALKSILPGVKFIVHETNEAYNKAVGDNSSGAYIYRAEGDKVIHINKQKANGRTVAHEVFHAVILDKIKGDKSVQEITARMMKAVYKTASPELKSRLDEFAARYSDESIRDEERLAELIGIIADGYPQMSQINKGIVKRWLDALAKMFGRKSFTDNEVIDLLNTLARKVSTGEVVSEEDISILGYGSIEIKEDIKRESKFIDSLVFNRFPTNKNTKVIENFDLSTIDGQVAASTLSDKLTAGELKKYKTVNGEKVLEAVYTFFGGIGYPEVTGRVWAASKLSAVKKIIDDMKVSPDGYRYLIPAVMSNVSHMSNKNMTSITMEVFKEAINNKELNKSNFKNLVTAASSRKGLEKFKDGIAKSMSGNISAIDMANNLRDYIISSDMTFESRKKLLLGMVGNPKSGNPKFSTVGTFLSLATSLADPIAKEVNLYQVPVIIRTKGNLKPVKTKKDDKFYHDSYGYHIDSDQEVEVLHLDDVYNLTDIIPEFTKSDGTVVSTENELNKKRAKAWDIKKILTNLGRTHGLSKYSAKIVSKKQQVEGVVKKLQQANTIDEMVRIAKEAKYSDAAISAFLKAKGYSVEKITNAVLSYDKKYIEARQKEEGIFTREGRNKLLASLDSFKRMFLSARSFLSKTTFIAKEGIDAGIKAQSKIASYLVSDLDNAIKKYDGDKEKLISDFDKFIRGEEVDLPDNFIEIGNAMRSHIDKLSYELIKSGAVDEYQSENIKKNIGSYLNRSYEVFDKKNWASKVDELTLQSAKNYLKKQLLSEATKEAKESGLDVDILLERKANQAIANLLNKENAQSFVSSGKTGSKDVSILKEKSDIPLEIRALMGEYTDPAQNYSRTIFKIASLVNNAKFLNTVKSNGMNVYLFKEKTGEFNTQIAGKESETMNPLNGLYTTKEIAGALKESAGILNTIETALPFEIAGTVKSTYEYYMKLLGSVKHLKTIESVGTHFKNVSGNVTFMLANGYFKPDAYRQSAKVIYNDFFNKTDKELREKMQEYIEAGIVDQSAVLGELRSMFKDEDFDKSFERRMNSEKLNPANSFIDKIKRLGKKTISIAENAYQAEDDYFKIVAYETEKSRYARAIYTKEYSDLSAIEKKDVTDKVSEMVKNILPNYGRVAGAVKMVKAFPIVGTFISFQTEALRTAYNIVNLSVTELKSSNPEIKKIGALRMTGIISSQAVKYAVMYLIGGAVLGDDDDEKKEKAKEFVAPWSKNSNIVITDESNGKFSYVDFSASDPFGGIVKPMNAALGGEDLLDGFVKGLQELVTPFTTPDILRSMFSDILENKNSYGGTLYNPSDSFENKSSAIVARVYKTFEPGTVTSVRKISGSDNPLNEMAGQFTGYKSNDVDILKDFGFKISAMKKKEIETRSIYNRAVNKFKNKEVTDAELQAAYLQSNKATIDNYKELKKSYDAALYFGTDRKEIKESMKDAYVSADVIIGIVTGKFKDLKKKKGIETDAQLKARNPLVYRKLMLFRARHRK